jgi:hypothetical protein
VKPVLRDGLHPFGQREQIHAFFHALKKHKFSKKGNAM